MKNLSLTVLVAATLFLTSCAGVMAPAVGGLYTSTKAPLTATSNTVGTKVGTAELTSILGIVATGDASINEAAKKAGITKISHVDYESFSVLGFYGKLTVYVYGE